MPPVICREGEILKPRIEGILRMRGLALRARESYEDLVRGERA